MGLSDRLNQLPLTTKPVESPSLKAEIDDAAWAVARLGMHEAAHFIHEQLRLLNERDFKERRRQSRIDMVKAVLSACKSGLTFSKSGA